MCAEAGKIGRAVRLCRLTDQLEGFGLETKNSLEELMNDDDENQMRLGPWTRRRPSRG